jgi:hypothetical protein
VIIGIKRVPGFAELQDAHAGARRMEAWANEQGIDHIEVLTDEHAPVHIKDAKDAIKRILTPGTVEHLLLYFSGHGLFVNDTEVWLLSDAPDDPDDAVNLQATILSAGFSPVPYVAIFSDACRLPNDTLEQGRVRGGQLFPNKVLEEHPVDVFYACGLGRGALEITTAETGGTPRAAFTDALLEALSGEVQLQPPDPEFVRPEPLDHYLSSRVVQRVFGATHLTQQPKAQLQSRSGAWVARLPAPEPEPEEQPEIVIREVMPLDPTILADYALPNEFSTAGAPGGGWRDRNDRGPRRPRKPRKRRAPDPSSPPVDTVARRMIIDAVWDGGRGLSGQLDALPTALDDRHAVAREEIAATMQWALAGPGRGAPPRSRVRAHRGQVRRTLDDPAGSSTALVVFDDETSALLPRLDGFVANVDHVGGELLDVWWEPSPRPATPDRAVLDRARTIRGIAAWAHREHVPALQLVADALDAPTPETTALAWGLAHDPTLGLYAAYAFGQYPHRGQLARIGAPAGAPTPLFDVALLRGELRDAPAATGIAPLLTRGWSMLETLGGHVSTELEHARNHLVQASPWSLYAPDATRQLVAWFTTR